MIKLKGKNKTLYVVRMDVQKELLIFNSLKEVIDYLRERYLHGCSFRRPWRFTLRGGHAPTPASYRSITRTMTTPQIAEAYRENSTRARREKVYAWTHRTLHWKVEFFSKGKGLLAFNATSEEQYDRRWDEEGGLIQKVSKKHFLRLLRTIEDLS